MREQGLRRHEQAVDEPRVGAVDRALDRGPRAGQVVGDLVTLDPHRQVHVLGLARFEVLVDPVLPLVLAVGDLLDLGPEEALGVILRLLHGRMDGLEPVLLDELAQTRLACATSRDLRVQVAATLVRDPHVREHQIDDVAIELAVAIDQDGRDPEALLVDLGRLDVERAGDHPTDVRPVAGRRDVADDLLAQEDRLDEPHVLQMRSPHVGVVHHVDVARPHSVDPVVLAHRGHGKRRGSRV